MNKRSITFQLSLSILTAITLVLAVIVFLNYDFSKKVLIRNIAGTIISQPDLDKLLQEMIIVSVTGLIVILLLIIFIFRRTLIPLSNIVESIRLFTFGERSKKKPRNEIELLADSLLELQQKYSVYITEQNQNKKDRRKYERDLKSAKEIQSVMIPDNFSALDGHHEIDLYASLHPAESIGGDLYDYFFIDPNHLLFAMGDVSGKGIPAALFMAVAHTMIKNKATILSAKQVISEVNKELSRQNSNQHFLTLFLGILDIQNGILNYCNAAHNYPFVVRSDRQLVMLEHTHGLPIGVYSNKSYRGDTIVLRRGDMIVLYTDGVTDCKDAQDHFYGTERLAENISNMMDLSSREVVSRLLTSLEVFRGKTPQADDISLMAIRYLGK
ncbi:MAG: PP2C family protein-serine/threonine phosphatase [Mangrovibacterium sp.]|nr:PP2C family protein-serine/threonine phosphatase [Mangrovibacterium sp.]